MSTFAKFVMAAAATVAAVVIGYSLLPRPGGVGGVPTNQPPSSSPAPTPAALPTGSIGAGTYLVSDTAMTLHPYTFTLPAGLSSGWVGGDGASRGDAFEGTGVELTTWKITNVYADSCHWTGTLLPVADTAALVAALTAQVGHAHSAPVATTIGGLPATKLTLSLDAASDVTGCQVAGHVHIWPDGLDESGGWAMIPGETITAYIIESRPQLMVLMTVQHKDSPAVDVAALQQILDSVRFLP